MGAWAAPLRKAVAIVLAAASLAEPAAAQSAKVAVDLELVLAVDISYSMDADEQKLQRDGYVAALTSKPVLDAVRQGLIGRIAVAFVEWAGVDEQRTLIPWTVIDGAESAAAFAARLQASPLRRAYRTSISGGLIHAARLFQDSGFEASRQVIDVSGDGPNNQGAPVGAIRDEVVERGVVINGLPLMLKRPSYASAELLDLDVYYRDCVVGGPGAFVLPVRGVDQFPEAVRTKLVMEISGVTAPSHIGLAPAVRATPVAEERPQIDCSAGEQLWRERFGD
ncbi:MAG: DUF1194 domain-containing protein [Hansschlegelia sp.]